MDVAASYGRLFEAACSALDAEGALDGSDDRTGDGVPDVVLDAPNGQLPLGVFGVVHVIEGRW